MKVLLTSDSLLAREMLESWSRDVTHVQDRVNHGFNRVNDRFCFNECEHSKDKKLPFTGHKSESMLIPGKGLMVGKEEVSNKYT